ncbi:hypothetical protein GP486_002547 [Trichoglossum hirsutum]|uniref:NACHT domain-containing protein n=1 Tax=Trichoglossum hirsutum TaxID=265104 RepID=A0A9P8LES7_9PEZI|nr:hypothetical protein GP486_002547 [Trichoglossum hirsutum]
MDGLSAAASVTAIIGISAKIISLCSQYSAAVKDAKKDIDRLQRTVTDVKDVLEEVKRLLDRQDKTRLSTTHKLSDSLKECSRQLQRLEIQLEPGRAHKAISRIGMWALRWPFTSKKVEKTIASLEEYKHTFSLALQVDQTDLVLSVDQKLSLVDAKSDNLQQKIDIAKLPIAKGASFDSYMEEHNARCFDNTRVELLSQIAGWVGNRNGKPIFWLNGMAGTGKSTIARTIAQSFADKAQLGASFFFKKGESNRGDASRFFTTVARDLMARVPELISGITKAIDADPAISERALKDQFEKLILQPLSGTTCSKVLELVVVIDALDECERDEDVRAILQLLSRTKDLKLVSLRVFVTSRPELPIRLGFKQMSDGTYQDLILHEVPKKIIKHDIAVFFECELARIREERSLPLEWPGERSIQTLVGMAIPLFIFAATVCRFIGETIGNPRRRLNDILKYEIEDVSRLNITYLPILDPLFAIQGEKEKEKLSREFQEIVGSIVILESPLSIASLAHLLKIPKEDIRCRLDSLHSVLSIHADEDVPVRLFHLSFREFLVDSEKKGKSPFWVDERKTHERLASKCLELLSSPEGLRQNMCKLPNPGTLKSEIGEQKIAICLSPELQYACRYWVHHLEQSDYHIHDGDLIHIFLQRYFLYWLEAMSLIGEAYKCIHIINKLQALTKILSQNFFMMQSDLHCGSDPY